MKLSNFFWFCGLWAYILVAGMLYLLTTYMPLNIPGWAKPVLTWVVPLFLPALITYANCQRYKHGHTDFSFGDTFGLSKSDQHATKAWQKAAYPGIAGKYLSDRPKDFVIGKQKNGRKYVYSPLTRDGTNIFLIGGVGSGKSNAIKQIMLSSLYSDRYLKQNPKIPRLKFNLFVVDIKGELFGCCCKIDGIYDATDEDNLIQVIQPSNRRSYGYDVLYRVHKANVTETEIIKTASDIAEALVRESGDNPYFTDNARKILSGVLIHYIHQDWEFIPIIKMLLRSNLDELLTEIVREAEEDNEGVVLDKLKGFVGKKDNESLQDVESTMKTYLDWVSYPDLEYALFTNPNRTSPAALDDGITNLDLAIEQDMLTAYEPLFRLITMQVIRHAESWKEKDARNTLVIIDEAKRIGKIDGLDGAMATLRSKHVSILLAFQSMHQFLEIYGEHAAKAILGLCELKLFLSGDGDEDTIKYVSTMAGKYIEEKRSYGRDGLVGQKDVKYNEDTRDIVDAQALMELREKQEIIAFLFGHYARFRKLRYWEDPYLGPTAKEIEEYNSGHEESGFMITETTPTPENNIKEEEPYGQ